MTPGDHTKNPNDAGSLLEAAVVAVCMSGSFRLAFSFPSEMTLLKGQDFVIDTGSPWSR